MQFVEDEDVAEVHGNCPGKEMSAEFGPDNERYGHHERREEVDQRFQNLAHPFQYRTDGGHTQQTLITYVSHTS